MTGFAERYGPWGLVAGASEGIGAAFATALAARGLDLILVARRPEPLRALAETLPTRTVAVTADLATPDGVDAVTAAAEGREVGLVVANAAYSPIGVLIERDEAQTLRALDVNCRAPLLLAHRFLPAMAVRGRGGFILMSSLAGQQGSPRLAVYAATKAFSAVLAEALWAELRGSGVDVLACVAGAVATPALARTKSRSTPGTRTPEQVVSATLRALGRGPRVVPGPLMWVSSALMSRLLPRRAAIAMIDRASRDLVGSGEEGPPGRGCARLAVVDDKEILHRITSLVDEEHRLRTHRLAGEVTSDEETARLRDLEESLDQCWDLLRRRRAARGAGTNPDKVPTRPRDQVEGYVQ